jgi:hypothetical protein
MTQQEFILSVMGIVGLAVVLVWLIYWVYRAKLLDREERRLMIERGIAPPPPEAKGWPAVKAREQELRFAERRLLIEKGIEAGVYDPRNPPPSFLSTETAEPRRPDDYLRRGLVRFGIGAGLLGAYAIFRTSGIDVSDEVRNWILFFALISPLFAANGLANILHYMATRRTKDAASVPDPAR